MNVAVFYKVAVEVAGGGGFTVTCTSGYGFHVYPCN